MITYLKVTVCLHPPSATPSTPPNCTLHKLEKRLRSIISTTEQWGSDARATTNGLGQRLFHHSENTGYNLITVVYKYQLGHAQYLGWVTPGKQCVVDPRDCLSLELVNQIFMGTQLASRQTGQ